MLSGSVDRERLETLIEINTLINSNYTDLTVLLTRIIESATRLTMGEASSLLLLNPANNRLYFEIALGTKAADVKRFSLDMGEGIAGWVAAEQHLGGRQRRGAGRPVRRRDRQDRRDSRRLRSCACRCSSRDAASA